MQALTTRKLELSLRPVPASWRNLVIVALGYFVLGRLSLLLALPPMYAPPAWPAAGFAVAAVLLCGVRILPGVFAGSVLTNTLYWFSVGGPDAASVIVAAALIGTGAAAHALAAAWLVRTDPHADRWFASGRGVTRFLFMAGPVACLVNASVGPFGLVALGAIDLVDVPLSSLTWWLGDTIGVIVVTPLALIASGRAGKQWLRHRWQIGVPLLLAVAVVITTYINAGARETLRIETEFNKIATAAAGALDNEIAAVTDTLVSLEGLFAASTGVTREDFHAFTAGLLARHPELLALSWNPYVTDMERSAFEAGGHGALEPLPILERNAAGELVAAAPARDYVPVQYIEPFDANAAAIGFNVLSEPVRRAALRNVLQTGQAAATGALHLIQSRQVEKSVLIFHPVGWRKSTATPEGFVVAALRLDDFLDGALQGVPLQWLSARLLDRSAADAILARVPDRDSGGVEMRMTHDLGFAARNWRLEIGAGRDFVTARRSDSLWVIIAGGLLLSGMLGAFLIVLTGHRLRERERLDELEQVNGRLESNIARRLHAEQELSDEKARAEAMLHSIADGVIATGAGHVVDYMNPVAQALTGWALAQARGRPVDEIFDVFLEGEDGPRSGAVDLCLTDDDAEPAGELWLLSRDGRRYAISQSTRQLRGPESASSGFVIAFRDVTEARALAQEMAHRATHDSLTGLVNAAEFQRRLENALASAQRDGAVHAMCFMDLDHFKQVNDTAGHAVGDRLLREISERIRHHIRARDSLARVGGDEFGLLLEHCPQRRAREIAMQIIADVNDYVQVWNGQELRVGISIGIGAITAQSHDISAILRRTDLACYAAKAGGRNRVVVADQLKAAPANAV